jgi:hypothetical protein
MSSTMTKFACIPELVDYLAEVSVNRRLIFNACLTSRVFNVSFTCRLYSELWFRPNNARFLVEDLSTLLKNDALKNDALKYTRTLDIEISPGNYVKNSYSHGELNERVNEGVQSLLTKLPLLEKFLYETPFCDAPIANQLLSQVER